MLGGGDAINGNNGNGDINIDFGPTTGVESDEISDMILSSVPNKTVYYVGENIDLSGLTLYIKMKNGSEIYERYDDRLSSFVVSGFNSSAPIDQQVVTVKYKKQSVSFTVKIKEMPVAEPSVQSITVNPLPKTEYKVGGSFIARTAKIVATFSDGSTQEIALNRSHLSNWAEAIQAPGTHEIKVVYFDGNGGYAETTFTITVAE
ncbi:MAG: bacterial Ig-like domain-containing protein [Clostridia bacterium]|nr:bacterial Ig-like domain-containing protein [Clostridia bacterium]